MKIKCFVVASKKEKFGQYIKKGKKDDHQFTRLSESPEKEKNYALFQFYNFNYYGVKVRLTLLL